MEKKTLTPFGKAIKKKLVDLDKRDSWLIEQVHEQTRLYFDRSYLHKILTGKLDTPKIVQTIKEILDISDVPAENKDVKEGE